MKVSEHWFVNFAIANSCYFLFNFRWFRRMAKGKWEGWPIDKKKAGTIFGFHWKPVQEYWKPGDFLPYPVASYGLGELRDIGVNGYGSTIRESLDQPCREFYE